MSTASSGSISLFVPTLGTGGAQRVMVLLANAFAERGIDTHLVVVDASGPRRKDVSDAVTLVDLDVSRAAKALPGLVRHLRSKRPDALLATQLRANILAVVACALASPSTRCVLRQPCVIDKRGRKQERSQKRALLRRLRKQVIRSVRPFLFRSADHVVGNSDVIAEELHSILNIPRDRISRIYNPIDVSIVQMKAQCNGVPEAEIGESTSIPVILGVGRFTAQKNFSLLVRAFARVREKRAAKLVIAGDGPNKSEVGNLGRKLDVADDIELPGFVDNPFPLMRASSVFVMSSGWEGFPNVLLEALASGTPVVSTDCPSGPREMLHNGKYGKLVSMDDPEEMAQAIIETLDNPPDSEQLVQRARDFDVDTIAEQYLNILLPEQSAA